MNVEIHFYSITEQYATIDHINIDDVIDWQ